MKDLNLKNNKYNYNSPESQELIKQFMTILEDITIYIDDRECRILLLENQLVDQARIRSMIRRIFTKLMDYFKRKILFFPMKIINKLKNKME